MTEPVFSVNFTARMLATEACNVGDLLVYDSEDGIWRVASAANRATADAGAQAIALTAYGGSVVGKVSYQSSGIVAAEVSGLGAGTKTLVRTSATGRIERIVGSPGVDDDVIGKCETDGRVHLNMGIPWTAIVGSSGGPGEPDNSVQYRVDAVTFGGAANVGIADGADLAFGSTFASAGDIRLPQGEFYTLAFNVMQRDGADAKDLGLIQTWSENDTGDGPYSYTPDTYSIGTDAWNGDGDLDLGAYTVGYFWASLQIVSTLTSPEVVVGGTYPKWLFTQMGTPGEADADHCALLVQRANFAIAAARGVSLASDDFGGGRGAFYFGRASTEVTTNPAGGSVFWIKPADDRLWYRKPSGEVNALVGTVDAQTLSNKTLASPIVTGTPVYRDSGVDIMSVVDQITTASTSPVVLTTRTLAAQTTEVISIIVRSRRGTSNTKRGSWRFVATVSREASTAVLDDLVTATPFNLNAGTVAVAVNSNALEVTVTPADTDSRVWDYELRIQGDT